MRPMQLTGIPVHPRGAALGSSSKQGLDSLDNSGCGVIRVYTSREFYVFFFHCQRSIVRNSENGLDFLMRASGVELGPLPILLPPAAICQNEDLN